MNSYLHFFKYMFKWQKFWLIIILVLNIVGLIVIGESKVISSATVMILIYINIFYFALGTSAITGMGNSNHPMQQAFSGKYLLSLPFSKTQLVRRILVAGSFTTLPLILSVLFIKFSNSLYTSNTTDDISGIINVLNNNTFSIIILVLCLYSIFILLNIKSVVEVSRKSYNKGTSSNFLLGIKNFIKTMAIISVLMTVVTYAVLESVFYIIVLTSLTIVIYQYFDTIKAIKDERISYWRWGYNLTEIAILVAVPAIFAFTLGREIFTSKVKTVEGIYSSGGKYFTLLSSNNCDEVMEAPNLYDELKKYNKYGVALAHAASFHTLDKDLKFKEMFTNHKDLLTLPIEKVGTKNYGYTYVLGTTPVHLMNMISENHETLREIAIKYPSVLNSKNDDGLTPLHYAAMSCRYQNIESIINVVNVNAQDKNLITPLMNAVGNKCWLSTLLLLKHGADVNLKDQKGRTVLDSVVDRRMKFLLQLF